MTDALNPEPGTAAKRLPLWAWGLLVVPLPALWRLANASPVAKRIDSASDVFTLLFAVLYFSLPAFCIGFSVGAVFSLAVLLYRGEDGKIAVHDERYSLAMAISVITGAVIAAVGMWFGVGLFQKG